MSKYSEVFENYQTHLHDDAITQNVEKILHDKLPGNMNEEVYRILLSCIDLTSLKATDNLLTIGKLTRRVNDFETEHPDLPNVAAICVYPNLVEVVRMNLEVSEVDIAAVTGGFPSAQTFTEVKVAETALAINEGATEIDTVLSTGKFMNEEFDDLITDIEETKQACREAKLKVILETGALRKAEYIKKAALLAIYSGADFIKTSTGKEAEGATPEAAYVMCKTIQEYYEKTGIKIGFKAAGGISTAADAVKYYTIVDTVLGKEWLNKELFRIGSSRLTNHLLSAIAGHDIDYF